MQPFRNFKIVVGNPERIKVTKHERVEIFTFYETVVQRFLSFRLLFTLSLHPLD